MIVVNAVLALHGALNVATIGIALLCAILLAGTIFSPRARWTYTWGAAILWFIVLRGSYYAVLVPWFHMFEHGGDLFPVIMNTTGILLLIWLAYAYTFGKASRTYYGLPPVN